MGPEHRGELHFVLKPTRLSMARDVAVIAVCVVLLAVLAADVFRARAPEVLEVVAQALP